jgi:MarR family transcriptional regulator, organic hydroperoxide resistance regulator
MAENSGKGSRTNALSVFNLFVETSHLVLKYADSTLEKSTGLSAAKFIVLAILENSGGTLTSAKLATQTGTKPHNITKIIDGMKKEGTVSTRKNDSDRRFVYISLTDEGRSILTRAKPVASEVVAKTMASMNSEDFVTITRLLNVLKKNSAENQAK